MSSTLPAPPPTRRLRMPSFGVQVLLGLVLGVVLGLVARSMGPDGVSATGMLGIFPTLTNPSHTTMLTGVSPATHGIYENHPFDPFAKNMNGWTWYNLLEK